MVTKLKVGIILMVLGGVVELPAFIVVMAAPSHSDTLRVAKVFMMFGLAVLLIGNAITQTVRPKKNEGR